MRRACTPGFSSALSTYSSPPSGLASQIRSYKSNTRAALTAKYGSRGKIQDRCRHGLSTSSASQRRTVRAGIDAVMPRAAVSRAGQLHFASGVPLAAGSSHASAITCATTGAVNVRGQPGALAAGQPAFGERFAPAAHHIHVRPLRNRRIR